MAVDREQRIEDELVHALRRLVAADARVQVVGGVRDRDGDRAGVRRGRTAARRQRDGDRDEEKGSNDRHASAFRVFLEVGEQHQGVERRDPVDVHLAQALRQAVVGRRGRLEQTELLLGAVAGLGD